MFNKKLIVTLLFLFFVISIINNCNSKRPIIPEINFDYSISNAIEFISKDPNTFIKVSIGEPDLLDPAADYETAGAEVNQNVLEPLIFYNRESATDYVPLLSTGWEISDDGLTYSFNIRQGVIFHNGNDFTPSDAAYSLQRAVLMGGPASTPSILLAEPILGGGMIDITEMVDPTGALMDDPEALQAIATATVDVVDENDVAELKALVDPEGTLGDDLAALQAALAEKREKVEADKAAVKAACEYVKSAIVADDANWTLTVTLPAPFAPFLGALGHSVGSILDKEWAIENGAWDDSCDTWQNYYAIPAENNPLAEISNGTGPFKFVSWDHATKTVTLERNDDYWRTEELWPGAHTGPAALKTVLIKGVDEWEVLKSMVTNGNADQAIIPREKMSEFNSLVGVQVGYDSMIDRFKEPELLVADQPLILFYGLPGRSRLNILFNQDVRAEDENNIFIGTGSNTHGDGIPANLFSDIHIRKAFNYCMDWDTFINDQMLGEAFQLPYLLTLPNMMGFDSIAPMYKYNLDLCKEEFKAAEITNADGKSIWDTGFYMIAVYKKGNDTFKSLLEILKAGLVKVNPQFNLEVLGLPWVKMEQFYQSGKLPIYCIDREEDIHDSHYWYTLLIKGDYHKTTKKVINIEESIIDELSDLVNHGVTEMDEITRDEIYKELNNKIYDYAPYLLGPQITNRVYLQRYVKGWYYNLLYGGNYYYELSKN